MSKIKVTKKTRLDLVNEMYKHAGGISELGITFIALLAGMTDNKVRKYHKIFMEETPFTKRM